MSFFHPSLVDCEKKLRKKSHKKVPSVVRRYDTALPIADGGGREAYRRRRLALQGVKKHEDGR